MNPPFNVRTVIYGILALVLFSLGIKLIPISENLDDFFAEEMYQVSYKYFLKTEEQKTFVKTFLPKNNAHQRIRQEHFGKKPYWTFQRNAEGDNIKGLWFTGKDNSYESLDYTFTFEGKAQTFQVPTTFGKPKPIDPKYLKETKFIQSNHPKIASIANRLTKGLQTDRQKVKAIFDFVNKIPSAPIINLTDAITALEQNRASCNGKSRLLVALARNLGYPARVHGGIILEEISKRTSHAWAEIHINDKWIPFDPLNGHFAYLPSNYLELYEGDEFLISHTPGIQLDYIYEIHKQHKVPFLRMNAGEVSKISPISFWGLIENKIISAEALLLLLMLPIGGLLVAFLRNVVGLRTFGVFLPVLIAFALLETGFSTGILLFIILILLVGIISRPFNNLGLLHTPKLVISLTLMVLVMTVGSYLGSIYNVPWLTALTFFPTIILTISAERFSSLIVEDGFQKATSTLFQTLIAVGFCYFLLSNNWLSSLLILFPEVLMLVIVLSMILGKYIGLRWTEILRFKPLLNLKTA
nr:7TM domain-containing protein [Allomuricauda sp.]